MFFGCADKEYLVAPPKKFIIGCALKELWGKCHFSWMRAIQAR